MNKKLKTVIAACIVALLLIGITMAVSIPEAKSKANDEQIKGTEQQNIAENKDENKEDSSIEEGKTDKKDTTEGENYDQNQTSAAEDQGESEGRKEVSTSEDTSSEDDSSESGNSQGSTSAGSSSGSSSESSSNSGSDSTKPTEPSKPAHTHSYGEWKMVESPTCTEEGKEERICSCGEAESRSVSAAGHKWETQTVTEETWEIHQLCNGCDYDYGTNPTSDEIVRHWQFNDDGTERSDDEMYVHSGCHDSEPIKGTKETTKTVCSVCHTEQ